jgi:hypothetical protein
MKKITIPFFASARLSFCGSLVLLLIAASSCHKDDVKKEKICYMNKTIINSKVTSTTSFSPDNKIESLSYYDNLGIASSVLEYEYDATGKISKIVFKTASGTVENYQTLQYNVDGLIAKSIKYTRNDQAEYPATFSNTYEYDIDKKLIKNSSYGFQNSQPAPMNYSVYEYNSSGDITKKSRYASDPVILMETSEYEYDDKKNYRISLTTPKTSPEEISIHNVKKVTTKDDKGTVQGSFSYNYVYNEEGYPVKVSSTWGETELEYNCK